MTYLQKRIASAIAAISVLGSVTLPVFAETNVVVSGNGAGSTSWADITQTDVTNVSQRNSANVDNAVSVNADTGHNNASFNTGGDSIIVTGDAKANVDVSNMLNANVADVKSPIGSDTNVLLGGNGAFSTNGVELTKLKEVSVDQNNYADVNNDVAVKQVTGGNKGNFNTGGDTIIHTGSANADVSVLTAANANTANVGGSGGNSKVDLEVLGNGAGSTNYINADLEKTLSVDQHNNANIDNYVDVHGKTGYNNANYSTWGDTVIDSGDAKANINIDNLANFNSIDVDGWSNDVVNAKISGNGANPAFQYWYPWLSKNNKNSKNIYDFKNYGSNQIFLDNTSEKNYYQDNNANIANDVYSDFLTGSNKASYSVGGYGYSDPAIITGNSNSRVDVSNSGNMNVFGQKPHINFEFDLGEVGNWLWNLHSMMM